ncbi:hypothetical protein SAMN06265348_103273 [Pedobacter westerhofensis]|uniref:Prepilin-type N-terminal cleavage/methylation domain-containing protein n=1 Tax=Pedobacter westerhofensis TaxID=425512 RepID=A0A521C6I4_9SPHI|nr:hypothetical protein [Pedobacter westerhofensis]SMO55062.1 hypothetical protein SAMN06265348_103273 [Pedobacter westerhofensis]
MAELKSSVKASTLLEVIVAMVIILVVFSLAMGIYNNVLGSTGSAKMEQISTAMEGVISKSINEQNWDDEESGQDSIQYKKTVTKYEDFTDLLLITVTATEHEQQVGKLRRIIKKTPDER